MGAAAAVVLAAALLVTWEVVRTSEPADPAAAARTSFPGLPAPSAEPTLASLDTLAPAPGTVVAAPGPFDDRYRLTGLRLTRDEVVGAVEITSDVSATLDLEVLAGFYDRDGRLLGTARHVQHADEHGAEHPEGRPPVTHPFAIGVPAGVADRVVAAAVGVPVLVNE
ncbi:hypothetical protein SAMN04488543_2308 [Friedmanniella luteola]|uniref:Uncharacterized protein n=1 Tax=Friedmanniella luteola TaxID=546871 RepID=A0A1H1URC4_9ACTN|nr:hypothetical protein [Friedmanniella luteola]SDS74811.1 hypothetical protein SAMN04488543_2308 [Friedmanniella luteola]